MPWSLGWGEKIYEMHNCGSIPVRVWSSDWYYPCGLDTCGLGNCHKNWILSQFLRCLAKALQSCTCQPRPCFFLIVRNYTGNQTTMSENQHMQQTEGLDSPRTVASLCVLSHGWLSATPWTVAPAMLLCPWNLPCRDTGVGWPFPTPGIEPTSLASLPLAGGFFTSCATWEAQNVAKRANW